MNYKPNGSNYHDHLCSCPGCNYDGSEDTAMELLTLEFLKQTWLYKAECFMLGEGEVTADEARAAHEAYLNALVELIN